MIEKLKMFDDLALTLIETRFGFTQCRGYNLRALQS